LIEHVPKKLTPNGPTLRSCVFVGLNPNCLTIEARKNARPKSIAPSIKPIVSIRRT
jgi:hypothetical protein